MYKKVLLSLFMASLAGAGVSCDDDEPLATKDATADTGPADAGKDAVTPVVDTGTPNPDAAKPDATADTSADAKADGGIPDATADVPKVDATVDAVVDTAPIVDTAPPVDTAPIIDTAPVVDTAPIVDTAPVVDTLGPTAINGCTNFADGTVMMSDRYINWGVSDGTPAGFPTLAERCLEVKVGQAVTFGGDFTNHPLAPFNGDSPNPIAAHTGSTQEDYTVTFTAVGTFGYHCTVHAPMMGAVHVIP
jgi:hypothetical protein